MIHLKKNTCPVCKTADLVWHLKYSKSQMEMFKCGHGSCKSCFQKRIDEFSCPICKEMGQLHSQPLTAELGKWNTFNEWYSEFGIYIESGKAQNVIRHTHFGIQLLRLIQEAKRENKKSRKPS